MRKTRRTLKALRRVYVRETGETLEAGTVFEASHSKQDLERLEAKGIVAVVEKTEVSDGKSSADGSGN